MPTAYIACPRFEEYEIANADIRQHNRRVVGNDPITPYTPVRFLPGIRSWDWPATYRSHFAGAHREWTNDQEGWETVNYKRKGRKARRWREVHNPVRTEA